MAFLSGGAPVALPKPPSSGVAKARFPGTAGTKIVAPKIGGRPRLQPTTVKPPKLGGDVTGGSTFATGKPPKLGGDTATLGSLSSGAAPAQPSGPPPLDSVALGNIAANKSKVDAAINQLNLQKGNAGTTLQSQLAQLAHQQPLDALRMMQGANNRGALYSSVEGQNQGNLAQQYSQRNTADHNAYSQLAASIAAKIAGLQQGEQTFENEQGLASTERASTQLPPTLPSAPMAPAAAPLPAAKAPVQAKAPVRLPAKPAAKPKGGARPKSGVKMTGKGTGISWGVA